MPSKEKKRGQTKGAAGSTESAHKADMVEDFEKLGVFYLGRPYDLVAKQAKPGWLLYDSKDLVTHAVCVGMTGSGKTGLCIGLLEEAAIDGIPALIIDPKGDLANLMLTFPQLRGEDFAPWINEDDARKKGLTPADYATQQADMWKNGLGDWGQSGERIQKLHDAADVTVYTPGSNAGIPVSILKAFAAPPLEIIEDIELLREQISTTVTSLLGLVGVYADPINSPPHILLSTLIESAWKRGQDLDLVPLIQQVQTPPFNRLGALDLESFYPEQDPTKRDDPSKGRFSLTKRLNNLIASPSFEAWMEGQPLDLDSMLYTSEGKPRIAIVSIAHLTDVERMFFVSLLLTQTLSWMRKQSGTTSLRAILYMDEIFGYFPPVANPPSKAPLLTLLKQARAYGLGVVLATQNPVDLDYKGLANTGTWFIGRLQTERDKARVLEGLEGAAASSVTKFNRQKMEEVLAGLGNRVFLMNNVHEDTPVIFQTRWTLSYLRGPLTRNQIKALMEPRKTAVASALVMRTAESKSPSITSGTQRPILPPDVPHYFIPLRGSQPANTHLLYRPMLLGAAQVRVGDAKAGIDVTEDCTFLVPMTDSPVPIDWDDASNVRISAADLEKNPQESAQYMTTVPIAAGKGKNYEIWKKDFASWLYRTHSVQLMRSRIFKEVSKPSESERDFRVRLQQSGREARDKQSDSLRQKYAPKIAALQDRIRRAGQMVERQQAESRSSQMQAAISVGASILGAFLGRKTISASNIGRATTAIRGAGRAIKESKDVGQAEENVSALQQQLADLESQFKTETNALAAATDPLSEQLETVSLKPTKANIAVKLVALAWTPHWQDGKGVLTPAWQ